jgi:hypothetical protein
VRGTGRYAANILELPAGVVTGGDENRGQVLAVVILLVVLTGSALATGVIASRRGADRRRLAFGVGGPVMAR